MKEEFDIDKLFQSNLGDLEIDPPARVKTRVDDRLNERSNRKRIGFIVVTAALVMIAVIGTWIQSGKTEQSATLISSEQTDVSSENKEIQSDNDQKTESKNRTIKEKEPISTTISSEIRSAKQETILPAENPITSKKPIEPAHIAQSGNKAIVPVLNTEIAQEPASSAIITTPVNSREAIPTETQEENPLQTEINPEETKVAKELEKAPEKVVPRKDAVSANRLKMRGKGMWMAGVLTGPTIGFNKVISDADGSMKENAGYGLGLELKRNLTSRWSLTVGFTYLSHTETFKTVVNSVAISDGDTVVASNHSTNKEGVSQFSLPLLGGWQIPLSERWRMETQLGMNFEVRSFTYLSTDVATIKNVMYNQFGVQLSGRVRAVYQINNFGWSIGISGNKDFKPGIQYPTMDRKRSFLQPQIGVHWIF